MKISEIFNLNKSQYELDFVDIDLTNELPLFLDAYIFSSRNDSWSQKCNSIINDFFRKIREVIELDNKNELIDLCSKLSEPNETCLGRSKKEPKGAFKSNDSMVQIFEQLFKIKSKNFTQFKTISELSDLKFYIDGVGNDTISDIVTTLIRKQLIIYTNDQCELYNIPTKKIVSKPYWNEVTSQWEKEIEIEQLVYNNKLILLVPKNIVFSEKNYSFTKEKFVQHDLLDYLKQEELRTPNSKLIQHRVPKKGQSTGDPYVTKKSLRKRDNNYKKQKVLEFSTKYPSIMEQFKEKKHFISLTFFELSEITNEELTDEKYNKLIDAFINSLLEIPAGRDFADEYHEFILGLLSFIFYPSLTNPKKETPIDNHRKRIDITYTNTAEKGFFYNLKSEITSNYIYVECKNYSGKISNPEFDQLAGRFNKSASEVGMLVCRKCDDFGFNRASGHYRRENKLILTITDESLIAMLENMKIMDNASGDSYKQEEILFELKRQIEVENY